MIIVQLPVHPVTKKILISEFGEEPIRLKSHDILFQILSYKRLRNRKNLKRLGNILTDQVDILVDHNLARSIRIEGFQIGAHLMTFHFDKMVNFVYSQVLLNENAKNSLTTFYQIHGITEDDLQLESAYKRWQRFWKGKKQVKRTVFSFTKFRRDVHQKCNTNYTIFNVKIPVDDITLDELISDFQKKHINFFLTSKKEYRDAFLKHFIIYIYYEIGFRRWNYISENFRIPKRSVFYGIKNIKNYIEIDDDFADALNNFLSTYQLETA